LNYFPSISYVKITDIAYFIFFFSKYLLELYVAFSSHVFLLNLLMQSYLGSRIGHGIDIEKVLNFDYVIQV